MASTAHQVDYSEIRKFITGNHTDLLEKVLNNLEDDDLFQMLQQQKGRLNETVIHLAARHSLLMCFQPCLKKLKARCNLNIKNCFGKTALHLAAESGNRDSIFILLKQKAKYGETDKYGNTPLHSAAACGKLNSFMHVIGLAPKESKRKKDSANNECPDTTSTKQDRKTFAEIVKHVISSEKGFINVRAAELQMIINLRNDDGDSLLDLAAKFGDVEGVQDLLEREVELPPSVLIKIVLQSRKYLNNPGKLNALKNVFRVIAEYTNKLSEFTQKIDAGVENHIIFSFPGNKILKYLLECQIQQSLERDTTACEAGAETSIIMKVLGIDKTMYNFNILQFACAIGADEMIKEILNSPGVYRFQHEDFPNVIYDVTNFSPETIATTDDGKFNFQGKAMIAPFGEEQEVRPRRKSTRKHEKKKLRDDIRPEILDKFKKYNVNVDGASKTDIKKSCLEIITYYSKYNHFRSWNVLNFSPFKELAAKYWKLGRFFYVLLMVHIVFMSCFTFYNLPTKYSLTTKFNIDNMTYKSVPSNETMITMNSSAACWLIWPICLVIIEIVALSPNKRYAYDEETYKPNSVKSLLYSWRSLTRALQFIFRILTAGSTAFFCLMTTWYCAQAFVLKVTYQIYLQILATTLMVGWIQTLKYFKYIRRWNKIISQITSALVNYILLLFVVWFLIIILGFGFALHVLNLTELKEDRTPAHTIYLAFNTIQNWGSDLLKPTDEYSSMYEKALGNSDLIRIVFSLYVCVSTLVLLNLLIAIMVGAYQDFKENTNKNHQNSECKLLYAMLSAFPLPHIKQLETCAMFVSSGRYYLLGEKYTLSSEIGNISDDGMEERKLGPVGTNLTAINEKKQEVKLNGITTATRLCEAVESLGKTFQTVESKISEIKSEFIQLQSDVDALLKVPTISELNVNKGRENAMKSDRDEPKERRINVTTSTTTTAIPVAGELTTDETHSTNFTPNDT